MSWKKLNNRHWSVTPESAEYLLTLRSKLHLFFNAPRSVSYWWGTITTGLNSPFRSWERSIPRKLLHFCQVSLWRLSIQAAHQPCTRSSPFAHQRMLNAHHCQDNFDLLYRIYIFKHHLSIHSTLLLSLKCTVTSATKSSKTHTCTLLHPLSPGWWAKFNSE